MSETEALADWSYPEWRAVVEAEALRDAASLAESWPGDEGGGEAVADWLRGLAAQRNPRGLDEQEADAIADLVDMQHDGPRRGWPKRPARSGVDWPVQNALTDGNP